MIVSAGSVFVDKNRLDVISNRVYLRTLFISVGEYYLENGHVHVVDINKSLTQVRVI